MNKYEELEQRANESGVPVIPYDFTGTRFKGLYCDGTVAIDKDLKTTAEKSCVLAEELGHYYTTVGDITDQTKPENRKQELRARMWAYNERIGLMGFIRAYRCGCRNAAEMADCLNVTESFLLEAIKQYRNKYGVCTSVDNFIIYFIPNLTVVEMISD